MSRRRLTLGLLLLAGLGGLALPARAAGGPPAPKPPPPPKPAPAPAPPTVLHVPADELDVLLRAQGKAVVLTYAEYQALLAAAEAQGAGARGAAPLDAVRLSAEGALDLTPDDAARLAVTYRVLGLAPGPRTLGWQSGGLAIESLTITPEGGAGPARYEEKDGLGRLHLEGPGLRTVALTASAAPVRQGAERLLDLWLPNPAAMALTLTVPPGMQVQVQGEGAPLRATSPAERPLQVVVRPTRGGNLKIHWAPAAQGTEGPSVLDAEVKTLYTVADGVVDVKALVAVDVLRTPTDELRLTLPADLAVHAVEGAGVTGYGRSEDRTRLTLRLEKPVLGAVRVLLQGQRPYAAGPSVDLPRVGVAAALRQRGEAALRLGADVNARAVSVAQGRRVAVAGGDASLAGTLRYVLFGADASLRVDVEPGALRVDANSTYYLNLAEPGQTLLATTTYRVLEGTLFRLSPRFPSGFDLRTLTLDGRAEGFVREVGPDGRVEIRLDQGVAAGGEVRLLATLERAQADWLPERETVRVTLPAPAAGATREEGYLAVGADPSFEVLDADVSDLLPVGAADLTARGLSAVGLVYGYRLDGAQPRVTLAVTRRAPLLEADVVTLATPAPRRLDLSARLVFRIQKAGVRRLHVDLPAWAGDQVLLEAPSLRAATRLVGERRPADVPAGYDRWQLDLGRRVLGTAVVSATWFKDLAEDDWRLEAALPLVARAPTSPGAAQGEKVLVVRRSEGLEVSVPGLAAAPDVRALEVTELPREAAVDPLGVLEVLRLPSERDGLALAVRKHGGAAVLGAIATQVDLQTAVAPEGLLRTRAQVTLFNIDRQFLEVVLPEGSTLIGAVVDGTPVKPLVTPAGVMLLTLRATRASADDRTRVALTYETRLPGPAEGTLRVAAPRFPRLEVLATRHEVAVEPGFTIASVGGDLAPRGTVEAPERRPWLLGLVGALGAGVTAREAAAPAGAASSPYGVQRRQRAPTSHDATPPPATLAPPAPPGAAVRGRLRGPGGAVPPSLREPAERPPAGAEESEEVQQQEVVAKDSTLKGDDHNETDNDMPFDESMGEAACGAADAPAREAKPGLVVAAPAADPAGGAPGGPARAGRPASPGEGGEGDGARGLPRASGRSRKGQLSLDVPVFLAPERVVAGRIGGGGVLELELVRTGSLTQRYLALLLVALAAGLLVVAWGRLPGWLVVLAGLAAAVIVRVTLGAGASLPAAALADAATALAGLLLLRRLALVLFGGRPSTGPAPAAPPPAASALLLALGLALAAAAGAAPARADEGAEPEAEAPAAPAAGGGVVIAPLDPEHGARLDGQDRVFLPLATWLDLQRRAYPDRDPELVALGQVVTLTGVSYAVEVGAAAAEGTARFTFLQRGRGMLLVPLPLPGLAITEARLDGQVVRLLLDPALGGAQYRVPLDRAGEHVLELAFQVPVAAGPEGRAFQFGGPTFAAASLEVTAGDFAGDLVVSGAGRVVQHGAPQAGEEFRATAYLGRPVGAGLVQQVQVALREKAPRSLPATVRTRAESRTVHSLRDGGTESVTAMTVHVLQGRAPFLDLALPEGVDVLEAQGPEVSRWETAPGRLRLVLRAPAEGQVALRVRTFRAAAAPERAEALPEVALLDTTGESGVVVVNADASLRVEVTAADGLFRTARPTEADASGPDGQGRVAGAWRFAARPAALGARTERAVARLEWGTTVRATYGDDRVRTLLEGVVRVLRAPVGEVVLALPGVDEVRGVEAPGLQTWWLSGEGEARRLHVRFDDLVEGDRRLTARLERRLGGQRDALTVPRWRLEGAQAERGLVLLFTLPDVEPAPGALAGLKALPPARLTALTPNVPGARPTHAFEWDAPVEGGLPLVLRVPETEVEAVLVTQISPSDELQRLEHLVLFDVRRGATDRLSVFVPDGGLPDSDVVRARDQREVRSERVTRTDADGAQVTGNLYSVRLQSAKSGLVEVTVGQWWPPARALRLPRPEGVKATRWFGLVRTFLDGEVRVEPAAGSPDAARVEDLPFLPAGLPASAVLQAYTARAPYTLNLLARRHRIEAQASAIVLSARAEAVVGLDGEARVRMRYRLTNRSRQFLPVRLPAQAVLFGAVAAGRPIKPLAGPDGSVLLPIPKVPLGGTGYEVSFTYRAPAAPVLATGGRGELPLPVVEGVEVDRTAVTLHLPAGYGYRFDTPMDTATEAEVLGDEVEVSLKEARDVLRVAQEGTLEQRAFACDNGAALVQRAEEMLAQYKQSGARSDRASSLETEVQKSRELAQQAQARCQMDAGVFYNEQALAANADRGGSTAQSLVDLDGLTGGLEDAERAAAEAPAAAANWRFNPQAVPLDKAGKKELLDLKERLQSELERRGAEERRKAVDVQEETRSRAGQSKAPAKQQTADEETARFDENRNNQALNDQLLRMQARLGQQAGVPAQQAPAAEPGSSGFYAAPSGGGGGSGGGVTVFGTLPVGPGAARYRDGWLQIEGAPVALQPGNFVPPTTPQLDLLAPVQAVVPGEWIEGRGRGEGGAARAGLMGVDVPLPAEGRTWWFTSARSGAALAFEASPEGLAPWLRTALAVLLLGGLLLVLRSVARRRAARAV